MIFGTLISLFYVRVFHGVRQRTDARAHGRTKTIQKTQITHPLFFSTPIARAFNAPKNLSPRLS